MSSSFPTRPSCAASTVIFPELMVRVSLLVIASLYSVFTSRLPSPFISRSALENIAADGKSSSTFSIEPWLMVLVEPSAKIIFTFSASLIYIGVASLLFIVTLFKTRFTSPSSLSLSTSIIRDPSSRSPVSS